MPSTLRSSQWPVDKVPFQLAGIDLADRPAAGRLARLVNRLAASGNQIMPVEQRLPVRPQAIGAGRRQPFERVELVGRQMDAVGDQRLAMGIVEAAAVA